MDVTGKTAIVTGGARGIGRGIVMVLASNGANVVVGDINLSDAKMVANEVADLGRDSLVNELDVTSQESVERIAEETVERFGNIDILVNNAGTIGASGWENRKRPNENDWDIIYAVNVKGMSRVIQVVSNYMKERRYGKIINIASVAGRTGTLTNVAYGVSKAGTINLTQSMALELAPFNINVNAICPGLLWTPMWERITSNFSLDNEKWEGLSAREIFNRTVKERTPLGREQFPEDIGNLATFLASDFAMNITGQTINVSGGSHIN